MNNYLEGEYKKNKKSITKPSVTDNEKKSVLPVA